MGTMVTNPMDTDHSILLRIYDTYMRNVEVMYGMCARVAYAVGLWPLSCHSHSHANMGMDIATWNRARSVGGRVMMQWMVVNMHEPTLIAIGGLRSGDAGSSIGTSA